MIIDSHAHVQRVSGYWDSPPGRILKLMKEAGIDKTIIMPYSDDPSLLQYTRDCFEKFPDKLIGYARLDPSMGEKAVELLRKSVRDWGFRGLKLHPVGNLIHPAHPSSLSLIREAARLKVPTLFHCGDEDLTLPFQIAAAAEKVPEATIILGHMGGYFHTRDAILAAKKHKNIYLETSAMPYPEEITRAVNILGAERILFASDGPGCPPDLELKKVKLADLNPEDEKMVLGRNIERILGFST